MLSNKYSPISQEKQDNSFGSLKIDSSGNVEIEKMALS